MRVIKAAGLTLIMVLAGLATAACGVEQPSIMVEVVNETHGSIYLPANFLPLRIKDSQGKWWRADAGGGTRCADCSEACESTLHGDPAPVFVEVRAGQTLPMSWDGALYERSPNGCSCGISCYDQVPVSPGKYTFEVSFDQDLPFQYKPYTSAATHDGTMTSWFGSGMGTAEARQFRIFRLTYDGESEINLIFK